VPRERQLFDRREDPNVVAALMDRGYERGLGEPDLLREDLHRVRAEVRRRPRDDAQLVAGERLRREDVDEREVDLHGTETSGRLCLQTSRV